MTREAERRDVLEEIDRRIVVIENAIENATYKTAFLRGCVHELKSLRATIAAGKHERKGE